MHTPVNISHFSHDDPGQISQERLVSLDKNNPSGQLVGGRGFKHTSSYIEHSMHNGSVHGIHSGSVVVGKYQPIGQVSGGLVQTPVIIVHS